MARLLLFIKIQVVKESLFAVVEIINGKDCRYASNKMSELRSSV